MITEFFLSIPYFIIKGLIGIIPTGSGVPVEFTNAIYTMWSYVQNFAFIIPISTILWCLGIILTFELGLFTWHATNWLLKRFKL